MKTILFSAVLVAFGAASARATPVDDMVKQGFACSPTNMGEVLCKKDGAPSKICNEEGSCFRIIYEGNLQRTDTIKTGSIEGFHGLSRSEQDNLIAPN